jgi:hypothetical protein
LQYPYGQGQIQTVAPGQVMQPQPGQPGGMVQSGGMVMSGSMGFQQPGVAPQGPQPGAQAPGAPPQGFGPQPGFQPSEPPDPNDPGVSQGSPDQVQPQPPPQPAYPPNASTLPQNYSQQRPGPFVNQQSYVQQQQPSINPVTPYMPQPPVQTNPGQTGQQPVSTNPVDLINQQLRGGGQRTGLGGPGGQALGAGIAGVATTSEMEGIKVYNKHTKYNEWEFIYDPRKDLTSPASRAMVPQPGFGGGSPAVPGAGQKK